MAIVNVILHPRKLKKGISYSLHWSINGKRERISIGFVSEIEALELQLKKQLEFIEGAPTSNGSPQYKYYVIGYLKHYKANHGRKGYEQVRNNLYGYTDGGVFTPGRFLELIGDRTLDQIDKRLLLDWRNDRITEYADFVSKTKFVRPTTINRQVTMLKALLNYAVDMDDLQVNYLSGLKELPDSESQPIGAFTIEEMKLIYKVAENPHWWQLMANTGMRLSEMWNLEWSDVKTDKNIIIIKSTAQKTTKNKDWRRVMINGSVKQALETLKATKTTKKYVLPRITKRQFGDAARQAIKDAGLEGSTHKFRHTFCSVHMEAKTPLGVIQQLAGHSDQKILKRYLHASDDYLQGLNVDI